MGGVGGVPTSPYIWSLGGSVSLSVSPMLPPKAVNPDEGCGVRCGASTFHQWISPHASHWTTAVKDKVTGPRGGGGGAGPLLYTSALTTEPGHLGTCGPAGFIVQAPLLNTKVIVEVILDVIVEVTLLSCEVTVEVIVDVIVTLLSCEVTVEVILDIIAEVTLLSCEVKIEVMLDVIVEVTLLSSEVTVDVIQDIICRGHSSQL